MSKLLALDWDQHLLRLVIANRHTNRLTIDEIQTLPLAAAADDGGDADPEPPTAQRLIATLSDPRFRGAELLVTVRRADVELRLMNLPAVPVEELGDIVRMQAMNEFSELSDDWPIDYLLLDASSSQTTVLAAAISPRRMSEYRKTLERAELRPKMMVLRPTATAMLVDRLESSTRPDVEICLEDLGRELELSVLRHGKPILIRTVQAPRSDSFDRVTFLAQEVKRTSLAARNQLHGDDVQRVVMFGATDGPNSVLGQQLQDRLELPVRVLDPFTNVQIGRHVSVDELEHRGQFAAAIGLLIGAAEEPSVLIDFLNPRKYEPPASRRQMMLAAVAATLLLLLVGGGALYLKLRSLDSQARQLQTQIQKQRTLVEAAEKRIEEVASIDEWQRGDINWLSQLREISEAIPGPDKARFFRWQADVLSSGDGQLILEGVVDQQQTIGNIDRGLRSEQRRVRTEGGDFEDREPGYPWRFKQTITVQTSPPSSSPQPSAGRSPRSSRQLSGITN